MNTNTGAVTATIQSGESDPVDLVLCRNASDLDIVAAVVMELRRNREAIAAREENPNSAIPHPVTLSVFITL